MSSDKCKIEIYLIFFASKLFVCPVISSLGIKRLNKEWRLVSTSVRLEGRIAAFIIRQYRNNGGVGCAAEGGPNNGQNPDLNCRLHVTRTTTCRSKSVLGVDGGAMQAIYQHRPDNEVPERLPVVDDDRIAWLLDPVAFQALNSNSIRTPQ